MGTQEARVGDSPEEIRAPRLLWLPAPPEAAFGLPMTEEHGDLHARSVGSVIPWCISNL